MFELLFGKKNTEPKKSPLAIVYSEGYNFNLDGHVFPTVKFARVFELFCLDFRFHGIEVFEPEAVSYDDILLVHTEEYVQDLIHLKITERTRYSELPLNHLILEAVRMGCGGTLRAVELTSSFQHVMNIGGGFHHSFPDHAEGFCYLNDVAIAVKKHRMQNPDSKILIVDLDVHQGNGNSFIFQNDPNVFTFSMHREDLYPVKETSDLDYGLEAGTEDRTYLNILNDGFRTIESKFKPDLVFYLAGADPYKHDMLGGLGLSIQGLQKRDIAVRDFADKFKAPVVVVTAGGYAKNTADTVQIHFNTLEVFAEL